jgi:hypothetical protein
MRCQGGSLARIIIRLKGVDSSLDSWNRPISPRGVVHSKILYRNVNTFVCCHVKSIIPDRHLAEVLGLDLAEKLTGRRYKKGEIFRPIQAICLGKCKSAHIILLSSIRLLQTSRPRYHR